MNRVLYTNILLIAGFVCLAGCASQEKQLPVGDAKMVDFGGSWELDYELSEHPNDKLRWLYEVTRSRLEQQAARRDAAVSGPSGLINAQAMNSLQGVIGLGKLAEMISQATVLKIDQSRDDITVHRENDFALTCDFQKIKQSASSLGVEACGWQEDQLVFQVVLPEGLIVNHRLVLAGNGRRLNVATTVISNKIAQPFTLNRVYMPFEPGKGEYNCEYTLEHKKTCRLGGSED